MAIVDLIMPKLGESIVEATILKWLKQPGETVQQDETVLEIATDKVDSEVPSAVQGVVEELLYKVNDVVPVGSVIARLRTGVGETITPTIVSKPPAEQKTFTTVREMADIPFVVSNGNSHHTVSNGNRFYSPLVLNIAGNEGVSMPELEKMAGTGIEGRVTKKDILQYINDKKQGKPNYQSRTENIISSPAAKLAPGNGLQVSSIPSGNVEIMEMDRMRKLIAEHMVRSKHTSPHVTSFTEADVTNLVQWRDKIKQAFEKREGTNITFTPLFMEAIVRCIKKYP